MKRDCPTCVLAAPVLGDLARQGGLTVYTQDDPAPPETVPGRVDDRALDVSHRLRYRDRADPYQVGQGVRSPRIRLGPWRMGELDRHHRARPRFAGCAVRLRRQECRAGCNRALESPVQRDWPKVPPHRNRRGRRRAGGDVCTRLVGRVPLVPPTEERVLRMLDGTARDPQEVLRLVPPALAAATVEKIAVNAVMAGCKPEYLPVCGGGRSSPRESFAMHGVLATTMFVGPVVIVNGPVRRRIGMNAKGNALGQGNRANAAIGRALQLVIRNIGEGRPQEVDRATLGNPGKFTYCFAEDEEGSSWVALGRAWPEVWPIGGDGVRRLRAAGYRRPEVPRPREFRPKLRRIAASARATSSTPPLATHCWWSAPNTIARSRMPAGRRRGSTRSSTGCARSPAPTSSPAPKASLKEDPPHWPVTVNKFRPWRHYHCPRRRRRRHVFRHHSRLVRGGPRGSLP